MKVVVTGATGFLGEKTAARLAREGAEVIGLGRNLALGRLLEPQGVRFLPVDLSDATSVEKAVSGQDYIIHCAALSSPWGKLEDFQRSNVQATQNILNAAKKAGVKRVVHVSTPSLYVDLTNRVNISEQDPLPLQAINLYAQTKRLAEEAVDEAVKQGLQVVTIRPQGIIGPKDPSILPRLMRVARKGILPVIGDGLNQIDLTYVDNVAQALVLAMKAPNQAVGRKYNITNGEPVALYPTLEKIFQALDLKYRRKQVSFKKALKIASMLEFACKNFITWKEPMLTRYSVCVLGLTRTLNIEAARRDLGYTPEVSMNQALENVIEYYKSPQAAV